MDNPGHLAEVILNKLQNLEQSMSRVEQALLLVLGEQDVAPGSTPPPTRSVQPPEPGLVRREGITASSLVWKLRPNPEDEDYSTIAWKCQVFSERRKDAEVHLAAKFLDEDGFQLDEAAVIAHVAPGATVAISERAIGSLSATRSAHLEITGVFDGESWD